MDGQLGNDPFSGGVSYITVYRALYESFEEVIPEELSTLAVTKTGEVFGKGYNSLITWFCEPSLVPMKQESKDFLETFERLDVFQGLEVKKICVEASFGVALTSDNKVYKWGFVWGVPDEAVVHLEEYSAGPCHCGRVSGGRPAQVGGAQLMYCNHTARHYKAYTHSKPPSPGVKSKKFILHDRASLTCPKCNKTWCTPSAIMYDSFRLSYCASCSYLVEPHEVDDVYVKIPIRAGVGVVDIACVEEYIWTLYDDRKSLRVSKYDTTKLADISLEMSPGETVKSIHCGQNHVAAVTNKGNVYCYGNRGYESARDRGKENRLDSIRLWKADIPGRVEKVNCGRFGTICLMADGSLYLMETLRETPVVSKLQKEYAFPAVSAKPLIDIVFKLKYAFHGKQGKKVRARVGEFEDIISSLGSKLAGMHAAPKEALCSTLAGMHAAPKEALPQPEQKEQLLEYAESLPENLRELFGKTLLSDLTLKLADGEFPAHCSVLFCTSEYFRKVLAYDNTPSTLDMSNYNPRAYRCLLQHLYRVTPDTLNLDDLLDLLDIAVCYKETSIINHVVTSLKARLNPGTVLKVLSRTKSVAKGVLVEACKPHVQSPEFKAQIVKILEEDPSKIFHLLPSS